MTGIQASTLDSCFTFVTSNCFFLDKIAIKICQCTTVTPVSRSNSARVHTPQILQPQDTSHSPPSPLKNSGTPPGMNIKQ